MKSGSLNLLEPSGPHRACFGTSLALSLSVQETPNTYVLIFSSWQLHRHSGKKEIVQWGKISDCHWKVIDTIATEFLLYVCGGDWIYPAGMYVAGVKVTFLRHLLLSVRYALSYTPITINLFVSLFLVQVQGPPEISLSSSTYSVLKTRCKECLRRRRALRLC